MRVRYSSHLYSESSASALKVKTIKPKYSGEHKRLVDGRKVLQACFDEALSLEIPSIIAFGEDVGKNW